MGDKPQMQQLQQCEEKELPRQQQQQQQRQQDELSEDMNAASEESVAHVSESKEDESTHTRMCIQEVCEQVSIDFEANTDAVAEIAVKADAQQYLNYQQQQQQRQRHHNHSHSHRQYNPKKSVSFKTLVDIFQLSDAWQLHVKKSSLKTEEDQAKRRIVQRNY